MGSQKHGFWFSLFTFFSRLFGKKKKPLKPTKEEIHVEPKYWPEVREFIDHLNQLIISNTIVDSNVQRLNQRIVSYVEKQINEKGQLEDIDERFLALDTVADRFLSRTSSKIVGLRLPLSTDPKFTEIVTDFKDRLHQRYQHELSTEQKVKPTSH